ncbi:Kef-type K+ transport system, membrane component KefB [Alkalispirochaeta americana]|uniref:Kef-type K+ transport system, membrane component KefB n=1 Tax=Alkalispirochaeta americana TaxID=159291 RepID=A0A1N6S471_9SPIO|nr:cation:proton antiporter [Alkalispirochaeta americana]SIQ35943.1 Kef-type K+ transport system, membrane component KefB [Alkalispirochaeta americana]
MEIPFSDPVLIFASVMVLILVAPLMARKLRLPEIVGLLLAGMIFGPYGFGLIARDATIRLLGEVGLLMIMFLAGLEIDLHQVRRNRLHSIVFGLITFLIPLAVGTGLAIWIMALTVPTAVLLSSMYSSHTLLTFPSVAKLGLTRSRAVTTTIGGTIITDTLALLVLAVIASSVEGDASLQFWLRLGATMTLYVVAVIVLLPRIGRWFLREVASDETVAFVFVLAVTFLSAYLAHVAGLEPIIGAFLAGLTLNSLIPEKSSLMARLHFTGNALFIPFFLLSVGMLVNVELLFQGTKAWVVIGVMTVTALVTKWLAAVISGFFLRYSRQESLLIYGMSVNQAAATLAAALVGYEVGLFSDEIITGTIVMIGITCFVGPLVTERAGKKLAEARDSELKDPGTLPSRVLIPVINKDSAADLLDVAMYLRDNESHEPMYPIHVIPDGPDAEAHVARGEELLAHMVVRSLAAHVPVTPLTTVDVNVSSGILRAVRENRVSTLVMGWDGHQRSRSHIFGRILDLVVNGTPRQILVNRLVQPVNTMKRIWFVLPPLAEREVGFPEAVGTIKQLAAQCGTAMIVYGSPSFPEKGWSYIRRARPEVGVELRRYESWLGLVQSFGQELSATDWVILFSARLGGIAWNPKGDRLPGVLSRRHGQCNLSVLYSASERLLAASSGDERNGGGLGIGVFSPERTILDGDYREVDTLVRDALRCIPDAEGQVPERLARQLIDIAKGEPVRLMSGVILLHCHASEVSQSTVMMAVSRHGISLEKVPDVSRIVIILVDPLGQEPGDHLAALGKIAGAIRTPGLVEKLHTARKFEDLLEE